MFIISMKTARPVLSALIFNQLCTDAQKKTAVRFIHKSPPIKSFEEILEPGGIYLPTVRFLHKSPPVKPFEEIPGPRGIYSLPFFGLRFQSKPFTHYEHLGEIMAGWHEQFGAIVRARIGNRWSIFLFDPTDIEKVFREDSRYPSRFTLPLCTVYDKRRGMQPSLTSLNGTEWYELRSPVQKFMLRPKSVAKYVPRLSQIADDFVASLKDRPSLDNMPNKLMEYSAECVGMLCYNTRQGCISDSDSSNILLEETKNYLECFGEHVYHVIPWYMFLRTPFYKKFEKATDYLYETTDNYIIQTFKNIDDKESDLEDSLLFDLLSSPEMTPEKVKRTIIDVFIGGISSTANTLTFLFFHLAKNQDKQSKLYAELSDVLPQDGIIDDNTLQKLPYLKACLKESFRMIFPVAGGTVRVLDKSIELQGFHIPEGTIIQMCNSVICRNEKYFQNQDQFIPERWLREKDESVGDNRINPFTHLPFGFGARKCIGQRFAEQEIYICTAKILKNFRLFLPPHVTDIPHRYSTFTTPQKPFSVLLQKR